MVVTSCRQPPSPESNRARQAARWTQLLPESGQCRRRCPTAANRGRTRTCSSSRGVRAESYRCIQREFIAHCRSQSGGARGRWSPRRSATQTGGTRFWWPLTGSATPVHAPALRGGFRALARWLPSACLVDFGQRCDGARRGRRTRPAPLLHLSEAQAVASIAISTVEVTTWDVVLPAGSIAATLPVKVRLGNDSRAEPVARQSHRS